MMRIGLFIGLLLALALPASGALVWSSTFQTDADGVVTFQATNDNSNPRGPQVSWTTPGKLQIHTRDNAADNASVSKSGRPLGTIKGGNDSFSGLYVLNYSYTSLWTLNDAPAYEFVGFLGSGAAYQNRQICGVRLRHWTTNRDNPSSHAMVQMQLYFNSVGASDEGVLVAGPVVDLGLRSSVMDPNSPPFKLAIGFDGGTKVLTIGLYDSVNNQLGNVAANLTTDVPGLQLYGGAAAEIGALVVDYLGWEDWRFYGYGAGTEDIWQVSSLSYFDTAAGAFEQLTAPTGSCCTAAGTCADTTLADCTGHWGGPGTTCATSVCTGACCQDDGSCSDALPSACTTGTFHGVGTQCASTQCPQAGACCLPDGTCALTLPDQCCGVFQGEGSTCQANTCTPPTGQVWKSRFDGDANGVVDLQHPNAANQKVGPASDGRLSITNYDLAAGATNKAGRALSKTVGRCDSFSALYQFRWTDLYQGAFVQGGYGPFEMAGFFSSNPTAFTNQNLTAVIQHARDANGDYLVQLGLGAGAGASWAYTGGSWINLGPNLPNTDLQLTVAYDGIAHTADVQLFDAAGTTIARTTANVAARLSTDLATLALDALGWGDYVGVASDPSIGHDVGASWSVDTLTYFDTAQGAFNAVNRLPGACCNTDGTCTDGIETQCTGLFHGVGSTCAQTACPQPGACCLPDGSCTLTTPEACAASCGSFNGVGTTCSGAACSLPGWQATFVDGSTGEIARFKAGAVDPPQNPVGPVENGTLQITVRDFNPDDPNVWWPDKTGRAIGSTQGGCSAFSALYDFSWSALNESSIGATEFVGFMGDSQPYQSRQVCGAKLVHYKTGSDYMLRIDLIFGTVGATGFGELAGQVLDLGPSAIDTSYRLAVAYNSTSTVLSAVLFDSKGQIVGRTDANLKTDMPGLQQFSTPEVEIAALAVNYVGWMDYRSNGGNVAEVWRVRKLSYYPTAVGALNDGSTPSGASADFNGDGYVDHEDYTLFASCASGPKVPYDASCVRMDLDRDGDVDQEDFGRFQRCFAGPSTLVVNCAD